ncbi:hypothetical protein CRYUN_Cryun02cG0153000 [Craigia yunnanensis]
MEREPNSNLHFPPGFRFHPSDEELIIHYLQNKVTSRPLPASVIAEIDLYKYNPWELPKKALSGEDEWYFFSPRDRKYPNGKRPNRAAASGYWKATDKPILTSSESKNIGVKKALVFYTGRPPKGIKTEWIMNEYRLLDRMIKPSRLQGSMRNRHDNRLSNQDCQVLALVLAGQALSPMETNSTATFQGSNSFISIREEGFDKVNLPLSVPSLDNYFTPLKRKLGLGNRQENLIPSDKNLNNDKRNEDFPSIKILPKNDLSYCSKNQSQDGIYNTYPTDSINEFHELNNWPSHVYA